MPGKTGVKWFNIEYLDPSWKPILTISIKCRSDLSENNADELLCYVPGKVAGIKIYDGGS